MKKLTFFLIFAGILLLNSCNAQENKTENKNMIKPNEKEVFIPPVSEEKAKEKADSVVNLMSLDEKLEMIKGFKSFYIKGFEKYGLPILYLSDATQGVHIRKGFGGENFDQQMEKSTAFPAAICLAATWNPEIARKYAKSIGEECRAGGVGVLLGPGMNIYRQAQCGRNFEYFGEDPFLAGSMIEKYVLGMQSTGTITTLKHFVANNTDYNRRASNSVVSERTLHEIYLPAFKAGVDAGAMAVMTSYNLVNGEWAGQSDYVINNLLRKQLGYKWLVMTDWWSVNDAKKVVLSGQDLEMPKGASMENINELLASGEISETDINRMVSSIIKTEIAMGLLDRRVEDKSYYEKFDEHVKVAHQTAGEGIVLLKNQNSILPLKANSDKKILLTGKYIDEIVKGGGSGEVEGYDHITMEKALTETFPNLTFSAKAKKKELETADVVIVSVGTEDHEGWDRPFALPEKQEKMIQKATELNKNVIVIINSGSGIRLTDWNDKVAAILYNWYPGQQGNAALAEILSGKISPSGHLPFTIEKEFSDSPGYGYLPEDFKFKTGWINDPDMKKAEELRYDIEYKEGVLVGYRWYDTKNIEPLYHFGHGLAYSSFEFKNLKLSSNEITKDELIEVSFEITNTGNVEAGTVAQIYVKDVESSEIRPEKELKAFEKVFLKAGESKTVKLKLDKSAFAFWSEKAKDWTVESGDFEIILAKSAGNVVEKAKLTVK